MKINIRKWLYICFKKDEYTYEKETILKLLNKIATMTETKIDDVIVEIMNDSLLKAG